MKAALDQQTIAAQATPAGRGGVGIIRVSGAQATNVAKAIVGTLPKPRVCEYHPFLAHDNTHIDAGLVLYFPGPHSFTGEDVIEFHGHGGPVVMDCLLKQILQHHDVRIANPGEFSQRAFLNGKLDLTQAEAIADLIDSASEQAARSAMRSLQGEFSKKIHQLVDSVKHSRMLVEASIDFPDEEVPQLTYEKLTVALLDITEQLKQVRAQAKQGQLLREGLRIVIIGKPNAGKSSLLNALSGRDAAIVTETPGTTRDVLNEHILIDGIPLHIIDTAGLRDTDDFIEQEGVRRAWQAIQQADRVLLMVDAQTEDANAPRQLWHDWGKHHGGELPDKALTIIVNKIDKIPQVPQIKNRDGFCEVYVSAKYGKGIDLLCQHLKQSTGVSQTQEGGFIARRRHLDVLAKADNFLAQALQQLKLQQADELVADDLRQVQNALGEITGEMTPDDLLGEIFSHFCIGK